MQSPGQEKKFIKAVLDTNVLISAYLFHKSLGTIADLIQQDKIVPCFIVSTFAELEDVMSYPKFAAVIKRNQTTPKKILKLIRAKSIISPNPSQIPRLLSDLPDNYILASAVANKVDCLITGDQLLLNVKEFQNTPIVAPKEFLQKFRHFK